MSKAGIFDPWRQGSRHVEPEITPEEADPGAWDPNYVPERTCVRFHGQRNGLNVWFTDADPDAAVANQRVWDLLAQLHKHPTHGPALRHAKVGLQETDVDLLVRTLRQLTQNSEAAAAMVTAADITLYIVG
jgi:hypothetical protein